MAGSTRGRRTYMAGWALVTFALAMIAAWKWMEASEQESHRLRYARQLLVANTGMQLPRDAEALDADDLRGRSDFDFFHWSVWSSEQIQLPPFTQDIANFVVPESVEEGIRYFAKQGYASRVGNPSGAVRTAWRTPEWQFSAVILRGDRGSLLSVTRARASQRPSAGVDGAVDVENEAGEKKKQE